VVTGYQAFELFVPRTRSRLTVIATVAFLNPEQGITDAA